MLKISDKLGTYVQELFPDESTDIKVKRLIENEFVRRLAQYQHTVRNLEMKYQMDFETFKTNNEVAKRGYSFEVENDFCDWEMAVDGIKTIGRKLKELREENSDN